MSELLDRLRDIGLPMTSTYAPFDFDVRDDDGPTGETITVRHYVGWTTDAGKANAAEEVGATVREYRSKDPQFSGWEVSIRERVKSS